MKKLIYAFLLVIPLLGLNSCSKKTSNESNVSKTKPSTNTVTIDFPVPITGYENFMNKAKEYESNGKYIYALGCFYDAYDSEDANEEQKKLAKQEYERIELALKNGDILLKEKTEFGVHDAQEELKLEAYQYFSEYCPVKFCFYNLRNVGVNYETRTANYKFNFNVENSKKYRAICYTMEDSFKNLKYHKTYAKLTLDDFTNEEAIKIINNSCIYKNIPFIGNNTRLASSTLLHLYNESNMVFKEIRGIDWRYVSYDYDCSRHSGYDELYFIDFSIFNSEGNLIKHVKSFPCYGNSTIKFNNQNIQFFDYDEKGYLYEEEYINKIEDVPSKDMNDFDEGNIQIQLDRICVPYGILPETSDGYIRADKIKDMKRIEIPLRNNLVIFMPKAEKIPYDGKF